MNAEEIFKSSQEQAVAAWIDFLNQCRADILLEKLSSQDINLESALAAIQEAKINIAAIIASNRGGVTGVHGFIAESAEVGVENARNLIKGLKAVCEWVNNNGPVDFYRNGTPIQQKFVNDLFGLGASPQKGVYSHMTDYPQFIEQGGKYQIPKDFYEMIVKLRSIPKEQAGKLTNSSPDGITYRNWRRVDELFAKTGLKTEDLEPSIFDYADVQKEKIGETLQREERHIREIDRGQRKAAYEESRPTLSEGMKATAVSAVIEGGVAFAISVSKKLKEGKKLQDFTADDWAEVGLDTGVATFKGGVRGASIYGLTNFTATPAPVASALVTAVFGMIGQASQLRQGNIDEEEFLIGTQVVCLEAGVSAASSLLGQAVIPVPILGAVIGNTIGTVAYSIAANYLSADEQKIIGKYVSDIKQLSEQLDARYRALIEQLQAELEHFKSILEFAFDLDVNVAFHGSIVLADSVGVDQNQILRSKADIDRFYTE